MCFVKNKEQPVKTNYNQSFYSDQMYRSKEGADLILDYLFGIIGVPASMIDFGCGAGGWLKAAQELGVMNIHGVEGEWISEVVTLVPQENIAKIDLAKELVQSNLQFGRYDLAISLEVAEHLPSAAAEPLVQAMVDSSTIILFGAAIPSQGGVNHINEQYQSYWSELFIERGFECFDIVRPHFWSCEQVSEDKRQNPILFVQKNHELCTVLTAFNSKNTMIDVVHPVVFNRVRQEFHDFKRSPYKLLRELIKTLLGKNILSVIRKIRN